jgi:prefoldin subunit 5
MVGSSGMASDLEPRIKVLEERLSKMESKVLKMEKEILAVKRLAQEALDHAAML